MHITFSPTITKSELNRVLLFHTTPKLKVHSSPTNVMDRFSIDPCPFNTAFFSCIQKGIYIDRREIVCPMETVGVSVFEQYERALAYNPLNTQELLFKFSWEHERNGHPNLVVYENGIFSFILTSALAEMREKIKFTSLGE